MKIFNNSIAVLILIVFFSSLDNLHAQQCCCWVNGAGYPEYTWHDCYSPDNGCCDKGYISGPWYYGGNKLCDTPASGNSGLPSCSDASSDNMATKVK